MSPPPLTEFPDRDLRERREAIVRRHMDAEMAGDLDATLATFDGEPEYDIAPLHQLHRGDTAVRELLAHLLGAFPDLVLSIVVLRHTPDAVIIEGVMTGTHRGTYAGFPASGRSMDLRAAVFFLFDGDRLLRETVYYDELTLLTQLGALPAPPAPAQ
jgi:steroid delta-isomerase-like uncharacterized protein